MKLIAPFGFYGWGNIGDEATLQGFARIHARANPGGRAWVGSRDPAHTRRVEPSLRYFPAASRNLRRRWAWMTADAVVFPGGTPIGDALGDWPLCELEPLVSRAAARGKPIAFIGTGTERLAHERSRRLFAETIAPRVTRWTVRCECDRERLIEYGVPAAAITATGDLAWLLEGVPADEGREYLSHLGVPAGPLVGVNVNNEEAVRRRQPDLLRHLAGLLDCIIETLDARVLFLCNEIRDSDTYDAAASRETRTAMRHADRAVLVPNQYWSPQFMMSLVGCCTFTLSTRYHFCLFSALQEVPFLAIQRSGKVRDLCDDLQWGQALDLADASPDRLWEAFQALPARRQELAAHLRAGCCRMRERSLGNAVAFDALRARLAG